MSNSRKGRCPKLSFTSKACMYVVHFTSNVHFSQGSLSEVIVYQQGMYVCCTFHIKCPFLAKVVVRSYRLPARYVLLRYCAVHFYTFCTDSLAFISQKLWIFVVLVFHFRSRNCHTPWFI